MSKIFLFVMVLFMWCFVYLQLNSALKHWVIYCKNVGNKICLISMLILLRAQKIRLKRMILYKRNCRSIRNKGRRNLVNYALSEYFVLCKFIEMRKLIMLRFCLGLSNQKEAQNFLLQMNHHYIFLFSIEI